MKLAFQSQSHMKLTSHRRIWHPTDIVFFMGSSLDSNDNRAYLTIFIQRLFQKEITVLLNFRVLILIIEIVVTRILTD